jgi:hypothetical protein
VPKYYKLELDDVYAYRFVGTIFGRGDWSVLLVTSYHPFDESWVGNVYKNGEGLWTSLLRVGYDQLQRYGDPNHHPNRRLAADELVRRYLKERADDL